MNRTGRQSDKSGYLVILLLLVGLTAFSHSMKELTEIAQWSVTPAEIPQTVVKIEKLESCNSKQSAPSVELPWLDESATVPSPVAPVRSKQIRVKRVERAVTFGEADIAKLRKLQHFDADADAFEVRVPSIQFSETGESGSPETPDFTFRAKARKQGAIKLNPRDREMILKTLNRSINLRIAS